MSVAVGSLGTVEMSAAVRSHSCRYDFPPKQTLDEKRDYKGSEPNGLKRQMEQDHRDDTTQSIQSSLCDYAPQYLCHFFSCFTAK